MRITIRRAAIALLCLLASLALPAFAEARPKADYTDPFTGMEFMAIPGGAFVMGDNQDRSASPEHQVKIKPFLIGRYEVTFEQYAKFCTSMGRPLPADEGWGMGNRPVINVTWYDAVAFTTWLSEKTGRKFRLPSEAEWEYAARGGMTTQYPWGDDIGKGKANCSGCGSQWDNRMTAPVGSFAPNGYGLHDVIGNIYELCLDMAIRNYQGAPGDGSPWIVSGERSESPIRGASWRQSVREMRTTQRCWNLVDKGDQETGFRVVLEN